jgi:predicted nucleic acid-binding protein
LVIVVDASLAVKWYLAEAYSNEARAAFERHAGNIVAPDLILTEVIGAMVRRANMNKIERAASEASIAKFIALISEEFVAVLQMSPTQMGRAANIAIDIGHPLKDCIYLALAMELDCELVTCDARFAEKAKGVWARVRVLGEG